MVGQRPLKAFIGVRVPARQHFDKLNASQLVEQSYGPVFIFASLHDSNLLVVFLGVLLRIYLHTFLRRQI